MSGVHSTMRGAGVRATVLCAAALLTMLLGVGGCSDAPTPADRTPVQTVERLLELRAQRSTDASAYAEVVADPQVAADLAASPQAQGEATVSPTPQWQRPYEASRETSTADVVVVWVPDAAHSDWPAATLFTVDLADGEWKTADAVEIDSSEQVPPPSE